MATQITLFVNCCPVKGAGSFALLDDWLRVRVAAACDAAGVVVLESIDFGKWRPFLVAAIRDNPPAPGRIFAQSGTPIADCAIAELRLLADTVVVATR